MKILAIIPARKGSKRLKKKNILKLGNKSLIQITIEFAKKIKSITDIIVSTDDTDVIKIAKKLSVKAPFVRPFYLSDDKASMTDVCLHALNFYEKNYQKVDAIILLQPTSPFRSIDSVNNAINKFIISKSKSMLSVNKFEINPLTIVKRKKNKNSLLLKNNNNLFKINGNFYLIKKSLFLKTKKFLLKNTILFLIKKDKETIDIDNIHDFNLARSYIQT